MTGLHANFFSKLELKKNILFEPGVVAHIYNPSTWKAEAGRLQI
jgi:hypothetical protein